MRESIRAVAFAIVALASNIAVAAVSADEARQLGTSLTIWGAEKAGNKEGTIPAYTGERPKPPASYDPVKALGQRPDPYNEKPLFTITPQNYQQHADKLSEGAKGLFKQYPSFRMDIYPSHRNVAFPKYVLDNMGKNATSCKTAENELVLATGTCYGGTPFPIPKTGNEVMWNHLVRFKLYSWEDKVSSSYVIDANGTAVLQGSNDVWQDSPFYDPSHTGPVAPNVLFWRLRFDTNAPARKAGEKYIILDPVDFVHLGRRVYQYIPGQRRVKLAPDLAYDTPSPVSGGSATMDETQLFLGALDRYDFKLMGKKELYIMYNNFVLNDYKACPDSKSLTKNFVNPDCSRWELHRVWVVQATLKPGYRHILPKRTFYFDEDQTGAGTTDDYDAAGRLFRVVQQPYNPYYELSHGSISDCTYFYDLLSGIWNTTCMWGKPGAGIYEAKPQPTNFYSPEAMAGEGIR